MMRLARLLGVFLITALLGAGLAQNVLSAEFDRVPIDFKMPTGQSVAIECQDEGSGLSLYARMTGLMLELP